jgi:hypothetical protein
MRQYRPLDVYQMSTEDNVKELFLKYFTVEQVEVPEQLQDMILTKIDSPTFMVGELGEAFMYNRHLKGEELIS